MPTPILPTPAQQTQTCQNQYNQSLASLGDGGVQNATNFYNQELVETNQIINNCGDTGTCQSGQRNLAQQQLDQAKTMLDSAIANYQTSLAKFKSLLQTCLSSITQTP